MLGKREWTTVALGEIATLERKVIHPKDIKSGTTYVGLEHIDSDGKFINIGTIEPGDIASTKFTFNPSHLLYGKLRPYLKKIARPFFDGVCSTDILPILPGSKVNRDFLFYCLRQQQMVDIATARSSGANLPRLSPKILEEFPIPLPPLPEQRRIAAILDKADEMRELRRQSIAKLDTLLRSVFIEMFGDPVANTKRWPMSSFGQEVSVLEYGPRFYNESYSPSGVRIVRITDLDSLGNLDFDAMPRMEVSDEDKMKYCLKPGDLVFARTGATVGKAALIREGDPECIAGAYFIRMRFKDRIHPLYARMVIASNSVQAIIANRSRQSAQQNFSGPGIRSLPLPVPPMENQLKLEKVYSLLTKLVNTSQLQLQSADRLFRALQQRAFSGQLFTDKAAAAQQELFSDLRQTTDDLH